MFLIFKPQFGGSDYGGIAGGYVIPTDKKRQAKKARLKKKPVVSATAVTPRPAEIVEAAKDARLDEVRSALETLTLDVNLELLREAQARLEREIAEAQEAQAEREREERAFQALAGLIAEGERLLAQERDEVLEIMELVDSEIWAALEVHEFTRRGRKRSK